MLHPKQARYQASLQPDSGKYIFHFTTTSCARNSTSWNRLGEGQNALALPSRYQHHINLLKTLDKAHEDAKARRRRYHA
jgi:hypothetical protein